MWYSQLTPHRAVANRFGKLAALYETTVHVPAINLWLRDLEREL